MSAQARIWRNHYHPAWLGLVAMAMVLFVMQCYGSRDYNFLFMIQPVVLCGLGLWMLGLGLSRLGAKWQRLAKEFRGLMPGALLAILGPSVISMWGPGSEGLASPAYLLGILIMAAAAFGTEFEQKTITSLLSAPGTRARIYLRKVTVLILLTAIAALDYFFCITGLSADLSRLEEVIFVLFFPAMAVCTGPYLSLKTRSTLAASVFMVAIPLALVLAVQFGVSVAARFKNPDAEFMAIFGREFVDLCWVVLPGYALLSAVLGWRTFARLELRHAGSEASGTNPLAGPLDRALKLLPHWGDSPTAYLVRKELRLQVVPWLLASVYLGLSLLAALGERLGPPSTSLHITFLDIKQSLAVGLGFLTLLFCGAACVAEERQLGTLEWQLTFPMAMGKQWLIKLCATVGLGLLLGVVCPLIVLIVSGSNGFADIGLPDGLPWLAGALWCVILIGIGIYASTISRNTIQAACVAAGMLIGIILLAVPITNGWARWSRAQSEEMAYLHGLHQVPAPPFDPSPQQTSLFAGVVIGGFGLWLVWLVLRFSHHNFVRGVPPGGVLFKQLGSIVAVLALGLTVSVGLVSLFDSWSMRKQLIESPYSEPRPVPRTELNSSNTGPIVFDSELAKRYGLQIGSTGVRTQRSSKAVVTGVPDDLAKRYGLKVGTNEVPAQGIEAK